MRPSLSLSLRSILVVALLLAGGFAGASSCASPARPAPVLVPLDEAVRRTVASGSARLTATITNGAGAVRVTGRTSWAEPRSIVATEVDGAPRVEVRVTPTGTWLRARPDGPWDLVPPSLGTAGSTPDWAGLLSALRAVGPPNARRLRATHAGAPATVDLDDRGRIRRLRIDKTSGHLDLRLSDHGIEVDVADP